MSTSNKILCVVGTLVVGVSVGLCYLILDRFRLTDKILYLENKMASLETSQRHSLKLHESGSRESIQILDLIDSLISTLEQSGVLAKSGERLSPVVVWKRNPKYTGIGPVSKIKKGDKVGHKRGKKSRGRSQ